MSSGHILIAYLAFSSLVPSPKKSPYFPASGILGSIESNHNSNSWLWCVQANHFIQFRLKLHGETFGRQWWAGASGIHANSSKTSAIRDTLYSYVWCDVLTWVVEWLQLFCYHEGSQLKLNLIHKRGQSWENYREIQPEQCWNCTWRLTYCWTF